MYPDFDSFCFYCNTYSKTLRLNLRLKFVRYTEKMIFLIFLSMRKPFNLHTCTAQFDISLSMGRETTKRMNSDELERTSRILKALQTLQARDQV